MSSLLQVEDVSKSDTVENDSKIANMKDKKEQEWEQGRNREKMFSGVCVRKTEKQHDGRRDRTRGLRISRLSKVALKQHHLRGNHRSEYDTGSMASAQNEQSYRHLVALRVNICVMKNDIDDISDYIQI